MANYKRLFLNGYSYYITIVTHQRNPILIENIGLLRESFKYAKTLFSFQIKEIVIMPDHLHMIIHLNHAKDYPKIISSLKRYFSKNCPKNITNIYTKAIIETEWAIYPYGKNDFMNIPSEMKKITKSSFNIFIITL